MSNPTLRLANVGGLANRMIELIFAKSLQALIPNLEIANINLPEWNIKYEDATPRGVRLRLPIEMNVELHKLAQEILERNVDFIEYYGYAQHMNNFIKEAFSFDKLFPLGKEEGFDSDTLVINIRGNEILDGHHPGYVLVPISFYKSIVKASGLRPVFFGQLTNSPYMDALRSCFPDAQFLLSREPLLDFDILRKSKNIIPAVSTFSWLAAWLSSAVVHFPVMGLFNPFQEKDHMLLPLSDARYRFYLFPISYSVPVEHFKRAHAALDNRWEAISHDQLRWRVVNQPRLKAKLLDFIYAFDPIFYREHWSDIASSFGDDANLARQHYLDLGFYERRAGFLFNERMYLQAYADAACAVGRGEYDTALDHYLLVGRKFGYKPSLA